MRIVTCPQMKEAEKYAEQNGISTLRLMENAGAAAARFIRDTVDVAGASFTVLCGKGNNGGDGFVAARKLQENGADVTVLLAAGPPASSNAVEMYDRIRGLLLHIIDYTSHPKDCLAAVKTGKYLVDAVFGTGFHGHVEENYLPLFEAANQSGATIFALDMPSGANADTGEVSPGCITADYTVTFAAPKIGQITYPAAGYCGKVSSVNIGIPDEAFAIFEHTIELLEDKMIRPLVPRRGLDSNKGDYGRLICVCGSLGLSGAAYLSATSALRCGAGLVTAYVPAPVYAPLAAKFSEAMIYPLEATESGSAALSNLEAIKAAAQKADCLLIGCGLSRNSGTGELIREVVKSVACPIVLDADGINAFDEHIDLLRDLQAEIILTPHPGEMARLLGETAADVQKNRLATAVKMASEYGVTVVLKGAHTVVASPDGKTYINPTGNPGMAKGGSGDILAGMIASFVTQGFRLSDAAACGVYIHGLAGDRCAKRLSQYGMIPTDMLTEIPQIFREMAR